jgi:hypothetical protein
MTQKWLIFEADATASYINWHLARNPDTCGYFTGCPPFLQAEAEAEGWTYRPPHVWIEEIPDAGA